MATYRRVVEVSYSPEQVYELVSGIRDYPDFIPWVKAMRVSRETTDGPVLRCRGEALVGFRGFRETFSTDVSAHAEQGTIEAVLVRGPFRKLVNRWSLDQVATGTDIDFFIEYEFSNPFLRMLASANLDLAVSRIMSAFLTEARRRYGPNRRRQVTTPSP